MLTRRSLIGAAAAAPALLSVGRAGALSPERLAPHRCGTMTVCGQIGGIAALCLKLAGSIGSSARFRGSAGWYGAAGPATKAAS